MRTIKFSMLCLCVLFLTLLAACGGASPDAAANALKPFTADLEKLITDTRALLTPLAQLPEARGNDAAACNALMTDKAKAYPQYTALGAAHLDGELFCLSTPQTTPVNIIDRAYFQRALQAKDLSIGDYQIGRATGKKSFGIGYPILDASNTPQGIVLSPVDLDWLNARFAAMTLPADAELILLDSKANVLARVPNSSDMIGKSIADTPLAKAMLAQIDGSGEFAGLDGVTRIYKFTAPNGSNKNLVVALGLKK